MLLGSPVNGAEALIRTLVDGGVDVCFGNPGTSEMHFVAALDTVPEMRAVLGLFEGVVTGAADGYGRMIGRPAATLLHLGPGLANGWANLHNARRARTPVVNVVGDHATTHKHFDAPLESDLDALAASLQGWMRRSETVDAVPRDAADAVAAATGPPGRIATLILPADVSWSDGAAPAAPVAPARRQQVAEEIVRSVARILRSGQPSVLLLGGEATQEPALVAAARVAQGTGARLYAETFPARLERGAGRPALERLSRATGAASRQLAGARHLVLVGAAAPVEFFAYPGQSGDLVPDGCQVHVLTGAGDDVAGALAALADEVGAPVEPRCAPRLRTELPTGGLTKDTVGATLAALLPDGAIVADESVTTGRDFPAATAGAPRHDWLTLTGGSIGQGLPLAAGAAVACPDRPVVCLQADGSAMYTLSALWTHARESLDITTVLLNNRSYAILQMELARVGAAVVGPKARSLLDLSRPDLDFVALAQGMGVPAQRVTTAQEFGAAFARALREPGPHLVEVLLAPAG